VGLYVGLGGLGSEVGDVSGTLGGIDGVAATTGISRGPSGRNELLLEADRGE
jgi:hypothetical protein